MAVEWSVKKFPVSSPEDFEEIIAELARCEEGGWDLKHVVQSNGTIIMFFKKKDQ